MDYELLKDLDTCSDDNFVQDNIEEVKFKSRNEERKERRAKKIKFERTKNLVDPPIPISKDYILNPTERNKIESTKKKEKFNADINYSTNYGLVAYIDIEIEVKKGIVIIYNEHELLIAEGKRKEIRKMEKSLIKLKQNVLWVGEAPVYFKDFRVVNYGKEVENKYLYYKSLINEAADKYL